MIREVSLVLSGANPALSSKVSRFSIPMGRKTPSKTRPSSTPVWSSIPSSSNTRMRRPRDDVKHAESEEDEEGETIQDVYDSMTEKQKQVLHYMLGGILRCRRRFRQRSPALQHRQEGEDMSRSNVFEQQNNTEGGPEGRPLALRHQGIVADASKLGSLKDAVESYALAHGITDIDQLFPDAQFVNGATPSSCLGGWSGSLAS